MFRPAKIYHANIIVAENKVNSLITRLHEEGVCQLKEASVDLVSKYSYEYAKSVLEIQARLRYIIDSLKDYKEIPQPEKLLKSLFKPSPPKKEKIKAMTNDELVGEIKKHLDVIEPKVKERLDNLAQIQEQTQRNNFIISNLSLVPDIKTGLLQTTGNIKVFLGVIATTAFLKIKDKLEKDNLLVLNRKEKNVSFLAVFSSIENSVNVDKTLHESGFEVIEIPYENKNPSIIIREIKEETFKLEDRVRKIKHSLEVLTKKYQKRLDILNEELDIAIEKINALQKFKTTKAISVLEAWIPAKDLGRFNEITKEITRQYYFEIEEREEAPTLFKNPKYIAPFEALTELYSPPKYKGFDPTPILAFSFALFFGFMLTDFAYGVILALLAYIVYRGMGKYNEAVKKFSIILIIFGISTALMGVIFTSYFGNFFQQLGIKMPGLIDSMSQVMITLGIAISIGALHLIIGLVAGFYENIRKRQIFEALGAQGVWILFMLGIVLLLIRLPLNIGLSAIGVAVVLQLVYNFKKSGSVPALLSIFGFSGFLGDLFSYARLMALAIGTSGIALAVNFMVMLVIKLIPFVGIPIAIVIFIIGHLFNMAMNGLGAFVHSTRLHFLEFFSKFYEGGGNTYKSFKAIRKNTILAR